MRIEDEAVAEAAELIGRGVSIREAARTVGCSESGLRSRLKTPRLDGLSHEIDRLELPVIVRDYSHLEYLFAYPIGDVHMGSPMHQRERWEEWLGYLYAHKHTSLLGNGDFFNSAIVGSKSDVYAEERTVGSCIRTLESQLRPLAEDGRLDGLADGNHEDRVYRACGIRPLEIVANHLGVPYFGPAALYVYRVGEVEYDVLVRHGTGNGQALTQLYKGANVAHADIYLTNHTHRQAVTADEFFVRDRKRMRRHKRYYVSGGSFVGWEDYAAERGYTPTRIGAPRIYFDGRKKDVHVSL